jgi:hypothetical protein
LATCAGGSTAARAQLPPAAVVPASTPGVAPSAGSTTTLIANTYRMAFPLVGENSLPTANSCQDRGRGQRTVPFSRLLHRLKTVVQMTDRAWPGMLAVIAKLGCPRQASVDGEEVLAHRGGPESVINVV